MRQIKKSNVITAIMCAVSISVGSFYFGASAASENGISYRSQGKIVFNNNTEDTTDDVVFDASDFSTINNMVVSGKKLVGTELNKYPSVNIDLTRTIPDFSELAASIDTLTDDATADSGMILNDATAYVKGAKIKGTIPSKGEASYMPGRSDQTIAAGQYLSGTQTIKGDAGLIGANIVEGRTIFGVTGTASAEAHIIEDNKSVTISGTSGTIVPSNGNNAIGQVTYSVSGVDANKIISGERILGVDGTAQKESHTKLSTSDIVEANGTAVKVMEAGKTYKIPSGKYADGDIYISAESNSIFNDCELIDTVSVETGSDYKAPTTISYTFKKDVSKCMIVVAIQRYVGLMNISNASASITNGTVEELLSEDKAVGSSCKFSTGVYLLENISSGDTFNLSNLTCDAKGAAIQQMYIIGK